MATKHQWFTYKYIDFRGLKPVKSIRKTRGKFCGWMTDGLGIRRAVFTLSRGEWLIPEYDLTPETLAKLATMPNGV